MNPEWRSRYDLAVEIARQAGALAKTIYDTAVEVEWKADQSPVTVADRDAEELIRTAVKQHFPDDGFLGEEHGAEPSRSGYRWVIDPIDGTRSFVRHIPIWATLIGLEYRGEQIAGVVYLPVLNQLYRALRGDGAYRNDCRIRVSAVSDLSESLFCYSSLKWFQKAGRERAFHNFVEKTQLQRGFGDFYGFMLIAEGAAEIMVDHGLHPWDLAALIAIVEEAGGTITDWNGMRASDRPDVVASNGRLHPSVLEILKK
jgi:histidinol-phosphatase